MFGQLTDFRKLGRHFTNSKALQLLLQLPNLKREREMDGNSFHDIF